MRRTVAPARETGEPVENLDDGRLIAKLVPAEEDLERTRDEQRDTDGASSAEDPAAKDAETAAIWDEIERLSTEIGRRWPAGVSAVEAARYDRRDR